MAHAHQPRGELVGEIALEDAVLDQHRLLRRRAFVVHVERAAPAGHGSVVDHRDFGAGDRLADEPGEGRGLLAVEVGFEAVAHGFMQQDAGPAGPEHHFHLAGRRRHRAKLQNGAARGLARQVLRAFDARELIEPGAAAAARRRPWW